VELPVDAAIEVNIGDIVYLDTGTAKPANEIKDIGGSGPLTLAAAQEVLHDSFVGVAMQHSGIGETKEIRIATAGVFDFDCDSAVYELGDRLGVNDNTAGTALDSQTVIAVVVTSPELSIGRVARRVPSAESRVMIEIHSTVMRDGPQAVS